MPLVPYFYFNLVWFVTLAIFYVAKMRYSVLGSIFCGSMYEFNFLTLHHKPKTTIDPPQWGTVGYE